MRYWILILMVAAALSRQARADWEYVRTESKGRGTLTVSLRKDATLVSLRQFCFAFGCKVFYQWPNRRAVVQNLHEHTGAIISSLTHVALVDGQVLEYEGAVLSEIREGYLIPMDLASKLALALRMGRIERHDAPVVKKAAESKATLKTLVIDPGHGGSDFGTEHGGIFEKDVAIIYAFKLRDELKKTIPDLDVVLTRDGDRYVSLPDRAKMANDKGAGLFLSLHVNHAPDTKVEGVETYILSPEATDDEAKRLALLENDTWLKTAKIKEAGSDIKKILIDMEQTKYIQSSALAASLIQQDLTGLDRTHGLKNRGVKQAMFYVLSQVAMPSTLVEMGFLSNTGDRSRLMDVVFRDEFVRSLVVSLKRYREKLNAKPEVIQ